jgi:membrane fusion protein
LHCRFERISSGLPDTATVSNSNQAIFSMRTPVSGPAAAKQPLFRISAMQARSRQGFGEVSINTPPSTGWVLLLSMLVVALLALALWLIEVPETASGRGLIMPAGGLIRVSAPVGGEVRQVLVREMQAVRRGDVVLALSGGSGNNVQGGETAARQRLVSLQAESMARRAAVSHAADAASLRRNSLHQRLAHLEMQLEAAVTARAMCEEQVSLARNRYERLEKLHGDGMVTADQLDTAHAALLESQLASRDHQSEIGRLRLQLAETRNDLQATAADLAELEAVAEADGEFLQRQLQAVRVEIERQIVATHDGVVSHIAVTEGQSVQQGQPLLTLHADANTLMAWFYVPARLAARLAAAQQVSLRIDAYPHQLYGTRAAVIESVSAIALKPSQVDVPLAVAEPVFEVRARMLSPATNSSINDRFLAVGQSLQADILQGRHRLYEWLLRKVLGNRGDTDA